MQVGRARRQGDWRRLSHGLDFRGKLCGVNASSEGGDLLYWCSRGGEVQWDAPVCVSACPQAGQQLLCPLPVEGPEENEAQATEGGVVFTTVTRRRLVSESATATQQLWQFCLPHDLGAEALLEALLGAKSSWLHPLWQAASKVVALAEVPHVLTLLVLLTVVSVTFWLWLLRVSLGLFVWTLLALSSLSFAALGGMLVLEKPTPFLLPLVADLSRGAKRGLGFFCLALGLCVLPLLCCLNRKKMSLALRTVREGCDIVFGAPLLALLPFLELVLRVGLVWAAAAAALLLLSAAKVRASPVEVFGKVLAGVPWARHFELTPELVLGLLYVGFAFFWLQELVSAAITFAVSRTAVLSHFRSSCHGVSSTLSAALRHSGSLVLGAALSACLLVPSRLGLASALSTRSYVDLAITASPLLEASSRASSLLAGSGTVLAARGTVLRAALLVGNVAFAAGLGLGLRGLLLAVLHEGREALWPLATLDAKLAATLAAELEALSSPTAAAVVVATVSFVVVQSFELAIHRAGDAALYCSLWEHQLVASAEQPSQCQNMFDTRAFVDPISLEIMRDPVVAADGHSYERRSIEMWFQRYNRSPVTNLQLVNTDLVPNHALRQQIEASTQSVCRS